MNAKALNEKKSILTVEGETKDISEAQSESS